MIRPQDSTLRNDLHPDMNDEQIAHLAGVFDAIGAATVNVTKNDRYSLGYQFQPTVRFQRPSDDEALMGKFTAFAEERGVRYHISEIEHPNREYTSYRLFVREPESIERFLTPLQDHLVTSFTQVSLLLNILPAVKDGYHTSREGFFDLMDAADAIRTKNYRSSEPKYTKEYFAEEWDMKASG